MNRMLTDEEIRNIPLRDFPDVEGAVVFGFQTKGTCLSDVAQAQLKKVVEWLNKRWVGYQENRLAGTYRTTFVMSDEEWHELQKEAGL